MLAGFTIFGTSLADASPPPNGLAHSAGVCGTPVEGHATCLSRVRVDSHGKFVVNATPMGYGPADLQSAYKLSGLSAGGRTVAIVDTY